MKKEITGRLNIYDDYIEDDYAGTNIEIDGQKLENLINSFDDKKVKITIEVIDK